MLTLTRRTTLAAIGAMLLAPWTPVLAAEGKPYLTPDAVPLLRLLSPPPANDAAQTKAELDEVIALQSSRTEAQAKNGAADHEETVFRFLAGMGIELAKDKAPLCAALFQRVSDTEEVVTEVAKKGFARPRPPLLNDAIKPIVKLSKSGAYPSGHTTFGTVTGVLLAEMLPEKRGEIGVRINDYAYSRLIVGVHYRSDLEPGKIAGTLIANALLHDAAFMAEFEPAKAELRKALGL